MAEDLDVRWLEVRAWLERVRRAAGRMEPLAREIDALRCARAQMLPWRAGGGGSGGASVGAHSDPTATEAERRMVSLDAEIADAQCRLDALTYVVGECGTVLDEMATRLGEKHARAFEWYYIDRMPTWSEVARELGVTRQRVWQLRVEAYAWIDANHRNKLDGFYA